MWVVKWSEGLFQQVGEALGSLVRVNLLWVRRPRLVPTQLATWGASGWLQRLHKQSYCVLAGVACCQSNHAGEPELALGATDIHKAVVALNVGQLLNTQNVVM